MQKSMRTLSEQGYLEAVGGAGLKSFLIVRHPFHRLVSAFKDKLEHFHEDPEKDYYYRNYGREMVERFRGESVRRFGEAHLDAANGFGSPATVGDARTRDARNPTFWEFTRTLMTGDPAAMDEHWKPVALYCSPCSVEYEAVVHFERLQGGEGDALMQFLTGEEAQGREEQEEEGRRLNWLNPGARRPGMSDEALTRAYFRGFTDLEVLALYRLYEWDFKLFGYTFDLGGGLRLPPDDGDPRMAEVEARFPLEARERAPDPDRERDFMLSIVAERRVKALTKPRRAN